MLPTQKLAELIRMKHHLLTQLHEVGGRQAKLAADGDMSSLLSLLGTKQTLIGALQNLEQDLTPYYAEDPEKRQWPSVAERAACAAKVGECNALLEQIVTLEKIGAEQITTRRNEVAEQLQQVHSAAQVRNAYQVHRTSRAS
jgi:hypothetical protein